ncbi:hypothetical protein FOIG_03820 [Fusarium odoratissimum NRRL 54006]|uniref:Uncharacterized protein n=2 Tax=Fusarium oxysporum species complex TaxID=171631 RepID=X0LEP2_FUSO5|nr:uncharacterized protein FOIG_03820 [Fusarium odoratissimum NRRL 54006]EXM07280.1 hypothetical protein FOIG_03820 [Fusarium odoratissimum NRRL 54006]TXC08557.1 hypothetical protein FocTR4_00002553 [Fusarium oxysporum f. sp. cubense]
MAAPQAMTDDEIAKHHLTLHSKYFPGKFDWEFPGPQASVSQRRQYMYAFTNGITGQKASKSRRAASANLRKT